MLDQGDTSKEYKRGNNVWALVKDMIIEGTLPTLPKEILDSSNPAIRALVEAREKSLEYNPSDRLSAKEITTILEKGVLDEKKKSSSAAAAAAVVEVVDESSESTSSVPRSAEVVVQAPTDDTEGKANDNNDEAPFPQNERGLHKLEFVHIAKTGYVFVIFLLFFDSLVKYYDSFSLLLNLYTNNFLTDSPYTLCQIINVL